MVSSQHTGSAAPTDGAGSRSALAKGLAVLESVLSNDRLSDIARVTGLSNSTVHRILSELGSSGWIYQDAERRYRPGSRLHALAGLLRDDAEIVAQAQPHLDRLRRATGMTVHFGLVKHDEMMYAAKLDGLGSYRMTSRVGGLVPLYSTGIGKAVMATWRDEDVRASVERTGMQPITSNTHTSAETLLEDLATTRDSGWAIDNGENEEMLRCVAAAVHNVSGTAIGGVSVSALEFETPSARLAEIAVDVVSCARAISSALGAPELA